MAQPLVSILINNYNYGHYLAAAIDSALAQSYEPIEVIVVDDGRRMIRGKLFRDMAIGFGLCFRRIRDKRRHLIPDLPIAGARLFAFLMPMICFCRIRWRRS